MLRAWELQIAPGEEGHEARSLRLRGRSRTHRNNQLKCSLRFLAILTTPPSRQTRRYSSRGEHKVRDDIRRVGGCEFMCPPSRLRCYRASSTTASPAVATPPEFISEFISGDREFHLGRIVDRAFPNGSDRYHASSTITRNLNVLIVPL